MSKELEDLLRRVSELEKQVKNGSFSAFGRSYSSIGSSSSDFVIKTKGQVKIQWGNKFIDLIKDGKINVNSKFIYTVDTQDNMGNKDGIYITNNGLVYIKSGDSVINLVGEIGTTYVSFMGEQQTTPDQKYTALKNIGFIYDNLEQVDSAALQNGLIYVQDQHKVYLIRDGQLEEFKLEIPNPFTQQFVIQKSDSAQGALLIRGRGIDNSLAFESLYLYVDGGNSYFDSEGNIEFIVDGDTIINVSKDRTTINNVAQSNIFQSINADSNSGFRLYVENGTSTLEVDKIIERYKEETVETDVLPEFFSKRNNIITSVQEVSDPNYGSGYAVTLKYENQYRVGDYLYTYGEVQVDDHRTKLVKIPMVVGLLNTESDNIIYVQVVEGYNSELDSLIELPILAGKIIFLASSDEQITQFRYSENNIDLLQYTQFSEEQDVASIKARIGDLTELGLKGRESYQEIDIEGLGVFSEKGVFKEAQYKSDYFLDNVDNSSKFASTEWIHKLLPKGTIVMFNGASSEIPEGWAICDGTNGTPNLIGRFIKSETQSGQTGGANEVTLTIDNLPSHTHTVQSGSITTSTNGGHSHTYTQPVMGQSDNANDRNVVESTTSGTTSSAGEHSHTVDVSGITLSSVGNNVPIKIEPLYYSLVFIMKIV